MLHSLVRQSIHVWRQSMRLLEEFHTTCSAQCTPSTSCVCHPSVALVCMDLADPVSSGKYIGTFVFTAPVAEPTVVSFTVPLNGCPINATATVMASFSRRQIALLRGCLRRDVVWWWWFFPPGGAYDSIWDSVKPLAGKYLINYFQYHEFVGCTCMLNYWFSSFDEISLDNYNYSRFS